MRSERMGLGRRWTKSLRHFCEWPQLRWTEKARLHLHCFFFCDGSGQGNGRRAERPRLLHRSKRFASRQGTEVLVKSREAAAAAKAGNEFSSRVSRAFRRPASNGKSCWQPCPERPPKVFQIGSACHQGPAPNRPALVRKSAGLEGHAAGGADLRLGVLFFAFPTV